MKKFIITLGSFLIFATQGLAQTWTGNVLEITHSIYGHNSDYTALYRVDDVGDHTRLRLRMGDEYTSTLEIGYNYWQNGLWTSTFSHDGYGNTYIRGRVGIGTTTLTEALTVNGKIKAEEIEVVVDVPADYVFEPDYNLMSLSEVSAYIKKNRHLPNVPSAEEIKRDGWQVGEMNNKLLEKIEELTLYLIQVKEENDILKERVRALEKRK